MIGASVRNVAREAGLSMGSLRHYFGSQAELLSFSLRLVGERTTARLRALDVTAPPRELIEQVVHAVLPLDEETRRETQIWLAFLGAELTTRGLSKLNDEVYDGLRHLFGLVIQALVEANLVRPELDLEQETQRLHALVDGLAVHAVTRPDRMPADQVKALLAHHLEELCEPT
nr:TetR/AcrR family transcriptional regulator [Kibdelosporangium phytohabitans]